MAPSQATGADTIRILVSTDNHVGFGEREDIRKNDSWRTFDEVMNIARKEDVDMVLLAGDLFHENKPSKWSMYHVMRSLRQNCLGMKPCELQFLSDANEVFASAFGHVNYEDPDINISIPVFSIHGNHDDPGGEGNYCALDLLQVAGLLNYYGRTPKADEIDVKPVLLQKGQTKLALYGLSNVREERMFRNFRDHKVKWFRPDQQSSDWFNLLAVHQNHSAHTATSYLPENMLPEWLNLVVWGHEHECLIDPRHNPETGFHVMQPGSSVATSLVPGEAVPKHVAVLSIAGREFSVEKHRLKTVRPFITQEIVLATDKRFKGVEKKKDNRLELTKRLVGVVEEMIEEANAEWASLQDEEVDENDRPRPLIRLKVECTAPQDGHYDIENPQRFSNRFQEKVANTSDVVHFYKKKKMQKRVTDNPLSEETIENLNQMMDSMRVSKLVEEYLTAQSLKVLPQAPFGDAVTQFVDKDDKGAMESFVSHSLEDQVKLILKLNDNEDNIDENMQQIKENLEKRFANGEWKQAQRKITYKPKPDNWDSDLDGGHWEDQPEAREDLSHGPEKSQQKTVRGRGRKPASAAADDDEDEEMNDVAEEVDEAAPKARGRAKAATTKAKAPAKAPAKKAPAKTRGGRGRKLQDDEDEEDEDVVMDDDDFDPPAKTTKRTTAATRAAPTRSQTSRSQASSARAPPASKGRQTRLNFSQATSQQPPTRVEISDDEISDDPFESAPTTKSTRKR